MPGLENRKKSRARSGRSAGIFGAFDTVGEMLVRVLPSHRWVVALLVVGAVGAACSLNPQPLPPDNGNDAGFPTGTVGGEDASSGDSASAASPDAAGGAEGGGARPDGSLEGDGEAQGDGNDASDAEVDAPADGEADGGEGDALDEGD
jgi:hypothetical protein